MILTDTQIEQILGLWALGYAVDSICLKMRIKSKYITKLLKDRNCHRTHAEAVAIRVKNNMYAFRGNKEK